MPETYKFDEKILFIGKDRNSGKQFIPADWAERLAGSGASQRQNKRYIYSKLVFPTPIDGIPSLVVSKSLERDDPLLYQFLLDFVEQNKLTILSDRRLPINQQKDVKNDKRESPSSLSA
ncbi:hypothetical protein CYQ88_05255 [Hydrogenovibrio sp. SC-1]|uniref:DUF3579 domain-containing protein n=1 Tax=Hydrogenovibrio sp. SC-1 TaxID=2065820 RepID=UPI000C7B96A4|nr:DUF3579 domain-containing protein [Hydrogenovibrio sp. SC-1]PLA74490.1 hypothetical protein CYQ88_05255 [Hydrogenovibrio sp. SC-1]